MENEREKLEKKYGNPLMLPGKEDDEFEPLEIILSIVDKHWNDVKTFKKSN